MSSASQPLPNQPNKNRDLFETFQDKYAAALAEARISEEHTATAGWQALYANHRISVKSMQRDMAKDLTVLAETMEKWGLTEDGEKHLAEIKKHSAELRDLQSAFELQTIAPVRQSVVECDRLVSEFVAQAETDEQRAPLVNVGMGELSRMEVRKVCRATWDSEAGRVIVKEPAA
jgi:hypothetical protein